MATNLPANLDDFTGQVGAPGASLLAPDHRQHHLNLVEAVDALQRVLVGPLFRSVTGYGAVGDGVANDTAPIQAALNAAGAAGGGIVWLPPGTFAITAMLYIPSGVWLRGSGPETVILQDATSSNAIAIRNADVAAGNDRITLSDFTLDCNRHNRPDASNVGIRLIASDAAACYDCRVERVTIRNVPYAATQFMNVQRFTVADVTIEDTVRDGITIWFNSRDVHISRVTARDVRDDCIALNSEADGHAMAQIRRVTIDGGSLAQAADSGLGSGIRIAGAEDVTVNGVTVEYAQGFGVNAFSDGSSGTNDLTGNLQV